jgi:aminoglycoside phosphotransferase (APT) family kinase protein
MPSREELVHLYGEKSGRSVQNILFYFIFGLFKIAGIVQQIYFRYKKGFTNDPRFKELDKGVELLGKMALQAIQKRKIDYLF